LSIKKIDNRHLIVVIEHMMFVTYDLNSNCAKMIYLYAL
jgi:hypothetical protein